MLWPTRRQTVKLIQDSVIDLEIPTPSRNDQLSIKIAE
jgi:hypothetical protein